MDIEKNLEEILEELLPNFTIPPFSRRYLLNSLKNFLSNKESIKKSYVFLRNIGVKDKAIAKNAHLLCLSMETIKKNYDLLSSIGVESEKVSSYVYLLRRNPVILERNYYFLRSIGIENKKISKHAHLLCVHLRSIKRNYEFLLNLGIKNKKISKHAHLLGRNPKIIKRNYQNHIGLLREGYKDRSSGRDILMNQPQLLGIPPGTMKENIQFLYHLGIDYHNASLLGSTVQLKRKKLAWILNELFDYRNLPQEQKGEGVRRFYDFVKANPLILSRSIDFMEKNKNRLKEQINLYPYSVVSQSI